MDFLGVGPLELVFILVIALIVLGPRDIAKFARTAGRLLNQLYHSEAWGALNRASREFRNLPNRLAREAQLEELDRSIKETGDAISGKAKEGTNPDLDAWVPSPKHPDGEDEGEGGDQKDAPSDPTAESDTPPSEPGSTEAADE
jgi:sec-independent protein translocase protein TatB